MNFYLNQSTAGHKGNVINWLLLLIEELRLLTCASVTRPELVYCPRWDEKGGEGRLRVQRLDWRDEDVPRRLPLIHANDLSSARN